VLPDGKIAELFTAMFGASVVERGLPGLEVIDDNVAQAIRLVDGVCGGPVLSACGPDQQGR
jgi:hypothetical protein